MSPSPVRSSDRALKGASLSEIAAVASEALFPDAPAVALDVKDISGNSGARTYLCRRDGTPMCIVKVVSGGGIMDSHENTHRRVHAGTEAMRSYGIAPPVLMRGADFHVERSAGTSVMQDYFHFDPERAPFEKVAALMARLHAAPTDWYTPLRSDFLQRDPALYAILGQASDHAPAWCLPWSGFDTGMPVLGVGNPDPAAACRMLELMVETGVYAKVMLCESFAPTSAAGRRQVVVHNDFKPDNLLCDPETDILTAIDYDLIQVGPAVMEFGLPYMMWLGSRFTTFEARRAFISAYLSAAELPAEPADVRALMLDCEVNTIVAFPGLLAHIYDTEVPLLRGVPHPTAKAGHIASGPGVHPTGLELVELLAEAVDKVRADDALADRCLEQGLVVTMLREEGFGSPVLHGWLREMQKNRMLRLFGIAEVDGGELYVSSHAKK
ncbi:MAG TPA: hypothetical protein DFR83_28295 [Deltaproteobacteria bacterium]|nr:hypothetical protein [Deltaproteobacteria bacterium]